jgi:hypothetical protein
MPSIDDDIRAALAFASPGQEPDWGKWVETSPEGLSQRARSELFLRAVNGEKLSMEERSRLFGYCFDNRTQLPPEQRTAVGNILREIATDYAGSQAKYAGTVLKGARAFVKISIDGKTLITTMRAAIFYGIWIFLSNPDLGHALCYCRYQPCGRFFFAIGGAGKRGRPQRLYCDHKDDLGNYDHGRLADNANAAERMAKLRPNRK